MSSICLTYASAVLYYKHATKEDKIMATASLFKNGRNQAIRLPKELEFEGVSEVEIRREGNSIILTPLRQTWLSFANTPAADKDFLNEREEVIEHGRVNFDD
jgi:antitoxin VapB